LSKVDAAALIPENPRICTPLGCMLCGGPTLPQSADCMVDIAPPAILDILRQPHHFMDRGA